METQHHVVRCPSGAWPVTYSRRAALRFSASDPNRPPPGARGLGRARAGVNGAPVVLVHGTNGRSSRDWFTLAPLLVNRGHDVYPFDWHRHHRGPDDPSATHVHALELAAFIDRVREETGALQVDVVAHSWGAVVVEYLLRCLPDQPARRAVRCLVGLAPTYGGTTVLGLAAHQQLIPASARDWLDSKIPTWSEQLPGSPVLTTIQASPPISPRVRYTTIVSRYDQVVTPYTASLAAVPCAEHVVVQDHSKRAMIGHIGILHHRVALTHAARALRWAPSSLPKATT